MDISFFPTPNIILQIGDLSLYAYGAMYAIGTICCMIWIWWNVKPNISFDTISDIGIITLLGGVLGGRLWYMLFYHGDALANPLNFFAVWNGGMSIHGGLLGGSLAFLWICKKKNIEWKTLADILVPSLAFALMLGRFGNFLNGELPGRPFNGAWAMDFGDGVLRHPAQLYAMAKDFFLAILFGYIVLHYKNKPFWKPGQLFFIFLASLAILRFIVEFFRNPDPQIGLLWLGLSMGQWFSVALFCIALFFYIMIGSIKNTTKTPMQNNKKST